MKTRLLALLMCLTLLSGCGASGTGTPEEDGYDGLVFSTVDRGGETWDQSVFLSHKLTMINFWEPWCGPCVGEMADLQRLQDTYAERGLLILGVYRTPDAEEDVDAVLSYTGVTYPILHYTQEFDAFESGYVPTTIFVDGEGRVIGEGSSALYIGSNSFEGWAAVVEDLL